MTDPANWLSEIQDKRRDLLQQIKDKKKIERDQANRRGVQAQSRLKTITSLASEDHLTQAGGKRKRKQNEEDTFGADDDDWAVYREIKNQPDDSDDDDDQQLLEHYENLLLQYDEEYVPADELDLKERQNSLFYRLRYGPNGYVPANDYDGQYRIHLNVERIRVPEILFQPSIIGLDQAGMNRKR
jgi:actin-related protein 5